MAEVVAEHESLGQRRNVVELGLVQQDTDFAAADVYFACPQVVQDYRKELRVTVDEDGPVLVAQRRNAAAEQGREEGVRQLVQGLPGRGEAKGGREGGRVEVITGPPAPLPE